MKSLLYLVPYRLLPFDISVSEVLDSNHGHAFIADKRPFILWALRKNYGYLVSDKEQLNG